jgi:hypothetical protein
MNLTLYAVRRSVFALGVVASACLIVACGSSSSSSSSSSAASAAASGGATGRGGFANRTKLAACLKQHGVTLPSRPAGGFKRPAGGNGAGGRPGFFGGGRAANPKFQAALKACGANFGGGRFNPAQREATVDKFVTCVRQHGYNLPKPDFSGHGAIFPAKIEANAKFKTASKSCQSLLAFHPGSGPPGAGSSSTSGT